MKPGRSPRTPTSTRSPCWSYDTWYRQAVDSKAKEYVGGFNVFRHYSQPFTPANRDVVTPNNDTPHSLAWLDLRAEPMVLRVPAVPHDRYYVFQLVDLFTYVVGYVSSATSACARPASTQAIT